MAAELTPELEKLVEERVNEKMKEQHEKFHEFMFTKVGNIIKAMKERFGEEAYEVIRSINGPGVIAEWKKKAEEAGDNSIESLIKLLWEPLPEHGFEYTMEKTDEGYQFRCTKCPMADLALQQGVGEYMFYEICNDWAIVEGFNSNIGFKITKTLIQGDDHCDHFFFYKDKSKQ